MECDTLVNLLRCMAIEDASPLVEVIRFAKKLQACEGIWQGKVDANSLRHVRLALEMGEMLRIDEAWPEDMRDAIREEIEKLMSKLKEVERALSKIT